MAKSQWNKLDYFLPMSLVKEKNALTSLKTGVSAINGDGGNVNSAIKVFNGFNFLGAEGIDMNYIPFVAEDSKWLHGDAEITVFCKTTNNLPTDLSYLMASQLTANIRQQGTGTIRSSINGGNSTNTFNSIFNNNTLYTGNSINTNNQGTYENGVLVATRAVANTVLPVDFRKFQLGNDSVDGSWSNLFIGEMSIASLGASVGVNQMAKNDIYRQWLLDLKINLSPDENILAGATITDSLQGVTVTDELKGN